ncbi:hypothetical protein D9M72_427280 [compost metagenome]
MTRRLVASAATALTPFSQNSKVDACWRSGQAQPGQSKPSAWFCLNSILYLPPATFSLIRLMATYFSAPQPAAGWV